MNIHTKTKDTRPAEILLVEDNEGDIILTQEAFEDAKFKNQLQVVEDGDQGVDFLFKRNGYENASRPDVILLDLNLPGTDGRELLEIIKKDETLQSIPVIILSSSSAEKDISECRQLGACHHMIKPLKVHKLLSVLSTEKDFWIELQTSKSSK